jgi:hypothetical protein
MKEFIYKEYPYICKCGHKIILKTDTKPETQRCSFCEKIMKIDKGENDNETI